MQNLLSYSLLSVHFWPALQTGDWVSSTYTTTARTRRDVLDQTSLKVEKLAVTILFHKLFEGFFCVCVGFLFVFVLRQELLKLLNGPECSRLISPPQWRKNVGNSNQYIVHSLKKRLLPSKLSLRKPTLCSMCSTKGMAPHTTRQSLLTRRKWHASSYQTDTNFFCFSEPQFLLTV